MASLSMTRAAAVVALLALGCARKDPDPNHFKLAHFDSGKQLADTLKRRIPTGAREAAVWEMMQGNGFSCGERGGIVVDQQAQSVLASAISSAVGRRGSTSASSVAYGMSFSSSIARG
jgi:hypothetical protein